MTEYTHRFHECAKSAAAKIAKAFGRIESVDRIALIIVPQFSHLISSLQEEIGIVTTQATDRGNWLSDIGKVIGCNHVDERLPSCVDEEFDKLRLENERLKGEIKGQENEIQRLWALHLKERA